MIGGVEVAVHDLGDPGRAVVEVAGRYDRFPDRRRGMLIGAILKLLVEDDGSPPTKLSLIQARAAAKRAGLDPAEEMPALMGLDHGAHAAPPAGWSEW